ncbi:MFS transporter [Phenylobacterium montanum]|uniref:MFS transporter n=1 Tax=Phenylobacterium montanum TaxID=2823693 RepID=A0A975G257_9CAUL|nr:MFS transporter [Caulobacter sp. S6]QUD89389.1 MFS transporter [Caulobacter sp. S6]
MQASADGQVMTKRPSALSLAAVALGNALEFYDFLTFSFFAVQIGHCFFPAGQAGRGLSLTLATFGVGFLTRPLGGLVIGRLGDRLGRRPAMVVSFSLMGVAITGLALTPGYAQIGPAAPVLLVAFRLLQGFALGGEIGPSTAYLVEAAPLHRRGLYVAVQDTTQYAASLAAGLVGFGLSSALSPAALDAWGWRCAFLVGAAVIPIGLVLRRRLPETLAAPGEEGDAAQTARPPLRLIILGLVMIGSATSCAYGLDYMTTYAQDSLKLPVSQAFGATIVLGVCGLLASPIAGLLSDRLGRKPVMISAGAVMAILVIPGFMVMSRLHSAVSVYAVVAVLTVLQEIGSAPAFITVTESLPRRIRSGGLALIYAVAVAVCGGVAQFAIKALTDAAKSPLAPAWYMLGALLVGLTAQALVAESNPLRARRRG